MPLARIDRRVNAQEDTTVRRAAALAIEEFAHLYDWAREDSTLPPQLTDWAHPTGTTPDVGGPTPRRRRHRLPGARRRQPLHRGQLGVPDHRPRQSHPDDRRAGGPAC
jgi:hypothetical protein